jgi:hypothetical protein
MPANTALIVTPPNATQALLRRPTNARLPLSRIAVKMVLLGVWLQHIDFRNYRSIANRQAESQ